MTAKSELEIEGNFLTHPFAELLVEIADARLTGSLRVSEKTRKCVVYFKGGSIVFAVSNARSARLFDILLRRERLKKEDLAQIPDYQNDFELCAFLQDKGFLTAADRKTLFVDQIESILIEMLSWTDGAWTFTSLARIRDGLEFDVAATPLLLSYARSLPVEKVLGRFRSLDESFGRSEKDERSLSLRPEEAFILSRADEGSLTAADIARVGAMPETTALHLVYTLWVTGLLERHEWQPAFSEEIAALMRTAKLELRREAQTIGAKSQEPAPIEEPAAVEPKKPEQKPALTVEEYLTRVETAKTFYDVLGIGTKATIPEIKQAYFSLAKVFHPDLFHAEGGKTFERVQHAFTELAQAHETLKVNETRDLYDYRMRKELADRETQQTGGEDAETYEKHGEEAAENFDIGFSYLMDGNHEEALAHLARAAHYSPKNARYRAYYGKALSSDDARRHKAETEMQMAVRLDPGNPTYRMLLAEFFIEQKLVKRAEGELNRLLAMHPGNQEARQLLAGIKTQF